MKTAFILFLVFWFIGSILVGLMISDKGVLEDKSKERQAAWIVFWWVLALCHFVVFIRSAYRETKILFKELVLNRPN